MTGGRPADGTRGADRSAQEWWRRPEVWAAAALVSLVLVVWALPSLLTMAPRVTGADRHSAMADVRTALVTLLLAGFTAGSLYYTARTFRLSKLAQLSQRFHEASTQLGAEDATVRVAGVQALAQLADEWADQRQSCINVICAFLRAVHDDGRPVASRYERRAGLDVLRERLHPDARVSWAGHDLDLSGIVLEDADLSEARFPSGRVSFRAARFAGDVTFAGAELAGAEVTFQDATFEDGAHVSFEGCRFTAASAIFDRTCFRGGEVIFRGATFGADCRVTFRGAKLGVGGSVSFEGEKTSVEGETDFANVQTLLHGGDGDGKGGISFAGARFGRERAVDDTVRFDGATFTGTVSFVEAEFHQAVSFAEAKLGGATLLLTSAKLERGGHLRFPRARARGARVDVSGAPSLGGRIDMSDLADGPPVVIGDSGRLVDLGATVARQTLDGA